MIRSIYETPGFHRRRLESLTKGNAGIERAERRLLLVDMGVTHATASYGATELYGNCFGGNPDDSLERKLSSSGYPLPGFEAIVVDPDSGRTLRQGEIGLLKVKGYTANGYLNNPDETAKTFGQDGFYVTGDLGAFSADGYFNWHSRLKEMVKTGGINVSPAEIEHLILSHPAITEAYVVGIPDTAHGEVAVAFVVALGKVTEEDVRTHVRSMAASFKAPARVIFRRAEQIQRTTSGKVAKQELRTEALRLTIMSRRR